MILEISIDPSILIRILFLFIAVNRRQLLRKRRESAAGLLKSARMMTKHFKDMQMEMKLANTKIDRLEKESNERTIEIINLKTRMGKKDNVIENQNKKIEALEQELNVLKKQHDHLSHKYDEVIKKNTDLESKIEQLFLRTSISTTTTDRTDADKSWGK